MPVLVLLGIGVAAVLAGLVRLWRRRDDEEAAAGARAVRRPLLGRRQP